MHTLTHSHAIYKHTRDYIPISQQHKKLKPKLGARYRLSFAKRLTNCDRTAIVHTSNNTGDNDMNALTTIQALAFIECAALFRITEFAVYVKNKRDLKGLLYDMTEMKYMFALSQVCFGDELN